MSTFRTGTWWRRASETITRGGHFGDDHAWRPHAGVVLQQARVQGGRMVGFEPGRLERGHGEGDRVRTAEAVCAEALDDLPDLVEYGGGVAAAHGLALEPRNACRR